MTDKCGHKNKHFDGDLTCELEKGHEGLHKGEYEAVDWVAIKTEKGIPTGEYKETNRRKETSTWDDWAGYTPEEVKQLLEKLKNAQAE